MPRITIDNIERYRGMLTIDSSQLKCDLWDIFDKASFDRATGGKIVPLKSIVSTKDQLVDPKYLAGQKADPRESAFAHMQRASTNKGAKRDPVTVAEHTDGLFYVIDGNATVQVLMFAGWKMLPVLVIGR